MQILSLITTTLNYSQFNDDGSIDVRIGYDHRVMDGGTVARLIADLESVLRGELLSELVFDAALHATDLAGTITMKSA